MGFGLILLGCLAVPVLADQPPTELPPGVMPQATRGESGVMSPTGQQVQEGMEEVEQEEEAKERELEGPVARRERDESRDAYAGISADEAQGLLLETFPTQFNALNTDPSRFLSNAKLLRPLGEDAAAVSAEGQKSLLEAGVPVRAEDEEGNLAKVDLSLVPSEGGFEPVNAVVDVEIPGSAEGAIQVGDDGLGLSVPGSESNARRLGDQNAFYPEVQTDSDLMVSPTSFGVEVFDQLRSAESPETVHFHVALPEEAELRPDGQGGAEIVQGGETTASIPFPSAVDAQGTRVPVDLSVEGDSVALHVAHREADFAYPILVDPVLEDWVNSGTSWYNGYGLSGLTNGAWKWVSEPYGWMYLSTECIYTCWQGSHRGLYVSAPSREYYPPEVHSHWYYAAPNLGSYIEKAWLIPFWRDDHQNCPIPPYGQPHDYDGFWGDNQWNLLQTNEAWNVGSVAVESWGRSFIVGLSSGNGVSLPCWRDLMVGGAALWLSEWGAPQVNSVSGIPGGWLKKDGVNHTISVNASDGGLGVQWAKMFGIGSERWEAGTQPVCDGTYEHRCPEATTIPITFQTKGFPYEGKVNFSVAALSPAGKQGTSEYSMNVDGRAPTINLSGELATVTAETGSQEQAQGAGHDKLRLPAYNLKINAKDGGPGELRAGVKEVKLYLDGSPTALASKANPTPCDSCGLEWNYPLVLTGLGEGQHTLEIAATDEAGNEAPRSERKIEFTYIPATGLKEEYVLQHFLLPDGHDYTGDPDYRGPELAVNVTNGNLIYRERDFQVQAPRAALELERIYNSQQPTGKDGQWGHGWSLAQTPELKAEQAPSAQQGKMVQTGAVTDAVQLPESPGQTKFNASLHASVATAGNGGYEVEYANRDETAIFSAGGQIEGAQLGDPSTEVAREPAPLVPQFIGSFGTAGSGNGQFSHPADVALDGKGNLWVADENHDRLQEFNSSGQFLKSLGSSGSGNGQFSRPKSIAFAADGSFWVADSANNRLEQFNEAGEFLKAVGGSGAGNGQFSGPEGIAIDAKGNLWIADTYNYRIQELNSAGAFIKVVNPSGLGPIEPTGLDVGPGGNVWVADWNHNRVVELSEAGALVRQFGTWGTGNGQFAHPDAVTVDSKGNVWVGDQSNQRIQEFSQSGQYMTQFGSAGVEEEQFSFSYPIGIAADTKGNLWITDANNDRVQQWQVPGYAPTFTRSFGGAGSANGQFAHPAGIGLDSQGNLWVVDENHSRLEQFNESGQYIRSLGSAGSGAGQFGRPTDVALAATGNLWVTDASNNRLEEFNSAGEFLKAVGAAGSGSLQFSGPESLAIDLKGNIWVADTYNGRLQELNEKGEFIKTVSSRGTGQGQLWEPTGVAVGPGGNVWVADWGNNRVEEFSESGSFVRQFGSQGVGNSQFNNPDVIDVDSKGNVWVADQTNQRIQEFNQAGEYLAQLGTAGSGEGQFGFAWPMGIATDAKGDLWVSDPNNNRVQEFHARDAQSAAVSPYSPAPSIQYSYSGGKLAKMQLDEPAPLPDPSMNVAVSGGLTTSVNAGAAGTATFTYASGSLASETDPEGEVKFSRDSSKRMTKVELPNHTWATIEYDSSSRVIGVTVKPAGGAERTTHFWYGLEPRETRVWGGGSPEIIYSIGEDGSVFKWQYAEVPPTFEELSGSLSLHLNDSTPLSRKDQTLFVNSSSPHQIASMRIIANESSIVAEETCQDTNPPSHKCEHPPTLEWIMNPSEFAPGRLNLEVVVTDFTEHSSAKNFFLTIPEPLPSNPEQPEEPTFADIKLFREDFGLDRNHSLTKPQLNELILTLLYEFERRDPVAVLSTERWGVPMRQPEVEEMEYREHYVNQAAEMLPEWAEEHYPSTYGGFYVNEREGSKIYVGFTSNQAASVAALKGSGALIAPEGQVTEFPTPPTQAVSSLEATSESVISALEGNATALAATNGVEVNPESNGIEVAATDVGSVSEFLVSRFGAGAPIQVYAEPGLPMAAYEGRFKTGGPVAAGQAIFDENGGSCTAGFGAFVPASEIRGGEVDKHFVLTAGHCFAMNSRVSRRPSLRGGNVPFGSVRRRTWVDPSVENPQTDSEAIFLPDESMRSHGVFYGNPNSLLPMLGVVRPKIGSRVCWSGFLGGTHCGPIIRRRWTGHIKGYPGTREWVAMVRGPVVLGDSGGPVWNPETQEEVGIITLATGRVGNLCHEVTIREVVTSRCPLMGFAPLLPFRGKVHPEGVAAKLGVNMVLKE